jgi:hypothetical protein
VKNVQNQTCTWYWTFMISADMCCCFNLKTIADFVTMFTVSLTGWMSSENFNCVASSKCHSPLSPNDFFIVFPPFLQVLVDTTWCFFLQENNCLRLPYLFNSIDCVGFSPKEATSTSTEIVPAVRSSIVWPRFLVAAPVRIWFLQLLVAVSGFC